MARRRLLWQLYPSYLLILVVALAATAWHLTGALGAFHVRQTGHDLEVRARLISHQIQGRLRVPEASVLDGLCKELGADTATRITMVLADGAVLGDSEEDPARMDNHAGRPEIVHALRGEVGVSTRHSDTLNLEMVYVAVPVTEGGEVRGCVRTALPVTAMARTLKTTYIRLAWAGVAIALVAALLSLFVSRRISRPLEEMKRGAQRFARGELERRLPVGGSEEVGALAEALNQMAAQLDERIRHAVRQRNEREAILTSMVEGVLAVDTEERIIRLNEAAARLLGVVDKEVRGRPIQEVVRKVDLQRFVRRTLQEDGPVEGDVVLSAERGDLHLQAHGTLLRGGLDQDYGALIVLNDVTRLRRLENLRKEFVANVSHELKTPITAIKGSAETLLGGALEDPEGAGRFVSIVAKQADRLGAIVDDLLSLSRIEQGAEGAGLALRREPLRPVLEAAIQACSVAAEERALRLNLFCAESLQARINAPLMEQALVNLLTNAIKYSDPRSQVVVDAARLEGRLMVKVQDWGCGIAAEHLPRLFERFYRVDQARSRALGGTGLGLAIVKHIAQAHGGEVVVHSTPGEGSVFTIVLPAP